MSAPQWPDQGADGLPPAPPPPDETAFPFVAEKPRSGGLWILMLCAVALLVAFVGAAVTATSADVSTTRVGDCLANFDRATLRTVDCTAAEATYQVVAIIEGQRAPTPPSHLCEGRVGATFSYWQGESGGTGRVLCLRLI